MDPDTLQAEAETLHTNIWITRGARLETCDRLKAMHNLSVASVTFASVYVIGLSLAQALLPLDDPARTWLALITIVTGVAILAMTLLEAGKSYEVRAYQFHQGVLALHQVMARARQLTAPDDVSRQEEFKTTERAYHQILQEIGENHETIDWERFKMRNPKDFKTGRCAATWLKTRWWVRFYARYVAIIVSPPLAVLILWCVRS